MQRIIHFQIFPFGLMDHFFSHIKINEYIVQNIYLYKCDNSSEDLSIEWITCNLTKKKFGCWTRIFSFVWMAVCYLWLDFAYNILLNVMYNILSFINSCNFFVWFCFVFLLIHVLLKLKSAENQLQQFREIMNWTCSRFFIVSFILHCYIYY